MSLEVMVSLVREAANDAAAQARIEAMTDAELREAGLNDDEIRSIRDGFLDRALMMGATVGDDGPGCCLP